MKMTIEQLNAHLAELADLTRLKDELDAEIDKVKDTLKAYMVDTKQDELLGANGEHAVFRPVISKRFDTTAFKKSEWAPLMQEFQKTVETRPFKFYA